MQFVYLIIAIVVGFLVGWMVRGNKKNNDEILKHDADPGSSPGRLTSVHQDDRKNKYDSTSGLSQAEKEKVQNIEQIKAYISTHQSVTNAEIVVLLGVSDATVVRYMDELEEAGVLRQVGKTGVDAHYEKMN